MNWGTVELEPEVRDWLEQLLTERFVTAAFYIDLLACLLYTSPSPRDS